MLAEIVLPIGTERVFIRDIPKLFAKAIHPPLPEDTPRQIKELKKFPLTDALKNLWCGPNGIAFPVRLKEEDRNSLDTGCWKHLPKLVLPIDEPNWQPYLQAFESVPPQDWRLSVIMDNPLLNQQITHFDVVEKYTEELGNAASEGTLVPRSPTTLLPAPNAMGEWLLGCFVTVPELTKFAGKYRVGVRFAETQNSTVEQCPENGNASITRNAASSTDTPIFLKECYPIDIAAEIIASRAYEHCAYLEKQSKRDELHKRMRSDANDGKLPGYDPRKKATIRASLYDMEIFVTPKAVDRWLDEHVPDIRFRFAAHAFKGFIVLARPCRDDLAEIRKLPPDTFVDVYEYFGGKTTSAARWQERACKLIEYVEEKINRQTAGFFTVAESAQILGWARNIDEKRLIKQMLDAHASGALVIRDAESYLRIPSTEKVSVFASLVKITDVDAWLEHEGVDYRFPPTASAEFKPAGEKDAKRTRPQQQQRFQETEILRVLDELGYTATALPKHIPGKRGVKAEVRAKLNYSQGVFNKAWERLRNSKEIANPAT